MSVNKENEIKTRIIESNKKVRKKMAENRKSEYKIKKENI